MIKIIAANKTIALFILSIFFLAACNSSGKPAEEAKADDRLELIPEPDKQERLRDEAIEKLRKSGCAFVNPDTSLSGIEIGNSELTEKIIGNKNQPDSLGEYHFYTRFAGEVLTLTQYPGDGRNHISIFKVEYADKADYGFAQLPIDTLKTEKKIRLGLTKKQIIERLGTCYAAIDSSQNYIELYYLTESPNDSNTGLLTTHNMPIYYASYKLRDDRLEKFEFGFEYP